MQGSLWLGSCEFSSHTELLSALRTRVVLDVQSRAAALLRMHIPFLCWTSYLASALETFHQVILTSLD
jgi:hypothetical protein